MQCNPPPTYEMPSGVLAAMWRGLRLRCPKCGEGKLFAAYLKPVQACSVCGEHLADIRADDGPPWLTILLVGHILLPIIVIVEKHSTWPEWVSMVLWPFLAVALLFAILPFAKGVFIGAIWKSRHA